MGLPLLLPSTSSSKSSGSARPSVVAGSLSLVAASSQNLSATTAVFNNSKGAFTWVFRVNLTSNGAYQSLMFLRDGVNAQVEVLIFPDNTIQFAINNNFGASKAMTFGSWVTVLAEYDGAGNVRLSLNNGSASSGSLAGPGLNGTDVNLGSRDSGLPSNGLFNFAGVLNRTLTNAERIELSAGDNDYSHLSAGLQSAAIWWMDFNTSGTLLTNAAGTPSWTNNNTATWSSTAG